jgi:2,5-diamino-6-(ribosylamino)-4(3H)-pyrimidinone 5'-phosphate reductase
VNRPTVIMNCMASVDGRITTAPGVNVEEWTALGLDGGANEACHKLYDEMDCDGMISGSETFLVWGSHQVKLEQPVYWPRKLKGFIGFDGRGRIDWAYTDGLIVVTREDVDPSYIEQLRRKNARFIQAGRGEHIDLHRALEALWEIGFRRLGLAGGGGINGAFLRAGLIDEVSVVIAPLVIGGRTTPTLFDAPALASIQQAARVELVGGRPVGEGAYWLDYSVRR